MRTIHAPKTRLQLRYRRHLRVRRKVSGTAERPRLVVYRSLKHIYAQLVNDELGVTLLGVSDLSEGIQADGAAKVGRAKGTGKLLAEKAKAAGITKSCSTGQVTVTMVVCKPLPTVHAKVDWSSNGR